MVSEEPSAFGVLLRQHRVEAALTQEELAERAGLSVRGISYLEQGVKTPRTYTIRQLGDALQLTEDDRATLTSSARAPPISVLPEPGAGQPLMADGNEMGQAVRTFLIADIRGYTRFTMERGDELAARLTASFAAVVRACVIARDGEVLELRGDEALCVFRSPRQALRAALELQTRLAEETVSTPELPLPAGIGVDAGEAIPVDGGYRGAALNLAARLCSLAGPGEVLTTLGVAHLTGKTEGLAYVERGPIAFKGVVEPVPVVQVLLDAARGNGADGSRGVQPQAPIAPESPMPIGAFLGSLPAGTMVGREEELGSIEAAINLVAKGTGQVLMLAGLPGVGKTRLAQEATLLAHQQGLVVACGRCTEQEQAVSLSPFVEALSIAYDAAPSRLQAQVPHRWPEVGALLAEPFPAGATTAPADPPAAFPGVLRAVTGFLGAMATERPVALLIDDLHWADPASLRLLVHLARHLHGTRLLLLGTYRDTALGHVLPLDQTLKDLTHEHLVERIAVRRLPPEGTAAMVAATIGDLETTEEFTAFVHRRTKGTPRLIDELLRSLGGHYRLIREIGAGGMGRVFQAVDTRTGQAVAAKIMFASREAEADAAVRFEQEGAVLARLQHPHIVEVYGTFMDEHASCIVMELLEGQSLGELMESQPLDLARTKGMAQQIAGALAAAHEQGIVHRDIKPDNVMVLDGDQVKVTDFGIARILRPSVTMQTMASTGMTLGTPLYMAPEQIEGKKVDARADLYSLGALLYHLVTGRPPFVGEDALTIGIKHLQEEPIPPSRISPAIPAAWDTLILKALAKDPAKRFQSAQELGTALAGLPEEPGTGAPQRREVSRRVAGVAGALLVLFALLVALWLHPWATSRASTLGGRIDSYLTGLAARQQFSGTVLVAQKGKVVLEKGYGMADRARNVPNTPATKYPVGGVSASFTILGGLWLEEHGKLADQAPVCRYLVGCPTSWRAITVRMLLDGTSNLPTVNWGLLGRTTARSLHDTQNQSLYGKPGTTSGLTGGYSNGNILVLASIIERVSGEPWTRFMQHTIFGPARMTHSGRMTDALVPPARAQDYSGILPISDLIYNDYFQAYSTAPDVYAYDKALFGTRLISVHSLTRLVTPRAVVAVPDPGVSDLRSGFGPWKIGTAFGHRVIYSMVNTGSFQTANLRFPRDTTTVILISNDDHTDVERVAFHVAAAVFSHNRASRTADVTTVPSSLLGTYRRTFHNADRSAARDPGLQNWVGGIATIKVDRGLIHFVVPDSGTVDEYYHLSDHKTLVLTGYPRTNQNSFCSNDPHQTPPTHSYRWRRENDALIVTRIGFDPCLDRGALMPGSWKKIG